MSARYTDPRPAIPAAILRQVHIEAGHKCSIAHCQEHTYVEIHHINENRADNRVENLVLLCDKHHKMAHAGIIDREDLREYKRLNRESVGLGAVFSLPQDELSVYLSRLQNWATNEQWRFENILSPIDNSFNILPKVKFNGVRLAGQNPKAIYEAVTDLLSKKGKLLLLGNGGGGKTNFFLGLVKRLAETYNTTNYSLPIYIQLHRLTENSSLFDLARGALNKHGLTLNRLQINTLLDLGMATIILDGLNEIGGLKAEDTIYKDIISFIEIYSSCNIIIGSRYISIAKEMGIEELELMPWDMQQVEEYVNLRLGSELSGDLLKKLGDQIDREWMNGCSMIGLCNNPLTLSMITAISQQEPLTLTSSIELTNILIEFSIARAFNNNPSPITNRLLEESLEDFAYLMASKNDILSTSFDVAIELCSQIIAELLRKKLVPANFDAYQLVGLFIRTGVISRPSDNLIEWRHQALQESLSVRASLRRFSAILKIANTTICPVCGYRASKFFEDDGLLYGECSETSGCSVFQVKLPKEVYLPLVREKLYFIDHTGLPTEPYMTTLPNSYIDERWMANLPLGGLYHYALRNAQDPEITDISFDELVDRIGQPPLLVNLELYLLNKLEMVKISNVDQCSTLDIFLPPINPSERLVRYDYVTIEELSLRDLEQEPDDYSFIVSEEGLRNIERRRERGLPIYHYYNFSDDEKEKVFGAAQRFGGQIRRIWGSFEEIVAEFKGPAWDFSKYNQE